MEFSHHMAMLAGYATAMFGWLAISRAFPELWPKRGLQEFPHPWREFAYAIIAGFSIIAIGQLYVRGWLIPTNGKIGKYVDILNQLLLFSPMLVLLGARRHPLSSAWLPTHRVIVRLGAGLVLALAALASLAFVRSSIDQWPQLVVFSYKPIHLRFAVHVFLEDLTIAILFVRLATALRHPWLVAIIVSALFAAGHIPGYLAEGASIIDLAPLLLDFALGAGVLLVVCRSADIWWFWCVHFVMDMSQFGA